MHKKTKAKPETTLNLLKMQVYHCVQLLYTTQHTTALIMFASYPPDNHHCSDNVYCREGGSLSWQDSPDISEKHFQDHKTMSKTRNITLPSRRRTTRIATSTLNINDTM